MAAVGVRFSCIVAMDLKRGIGKNNDLPWKIRGDMKFFTEKTSEVKTEGKQNAVIMGRKVWESIPEKFRPLKGRLNIVLSRTLSEPPQGAQLCRSFEQALTILSTDPYTEKIENVFVCGGSALYKDAIAHSACTRIYITYIDQEFDCDVFFPEFDQNTYHLVEDPDVPSVQHEEKGIKYKFCVYDRCQ
ncbi:dihydrofolate reductase isoform X1 [Nematostella vectensis]|nr:dihydrofolate reductase isoform X1 [Nematostella vectensis]